MARILLTRMTKIAATVFLLMLLTLGVLYARYPRLVEFPWVASRGESLTSMLEFATWNYYFSIYIAKMEMNPQLGVKDFSLALRDLNALEEPNLLELGKVEWHQGHFIAAVSHLEQYHEESEASKSSLFWLGMSYLRAAEATNCLTRLTVGADADHHNSHGGVGGAGNVCALPLQPHGSTRYADKAAETFRKLLVDYEPEDRLYRWLLNFSYMAADAYPGDVPESYLPSQNFVSHFYDDMKREQERRYAHLSFSDRARELGVDLLDAGRGVAVEDFNRDGHLDIVTGGFYTPVKYYQNTGNGDFSDRSTESGVDGVKGTHLITAADYNNDGWIDIFASRPMGTKTGDFILMRNNGDGTFSDVTVAMGLLQAPDQREEQIYTWASAWGDIDNDGDLDLFVSNWQLYGGIGGRGTNGFGPNMGSKLYRNDGSRFVDVTEEKGLGDLVNGHNCIGVAFGDYDRDGFVDLAVTRLWIPGMSVLRNVEGRYFETVFENDTWGFMVTFVDVDQDGRLDVLVGGVGTAHAAAKQVVFGEEFEKYDSGTAVWFQTQDGVWEEHDEFFSGNMPAATMGVNFGDLNNDGYYDFYMGTGNPEGWMIVPNFMYIGREGIVEGTVGTDNVSMLFGFGTIQKGHGIVFFDYDNDGDQDIYSSLGGMWPGDAWPNQFFVNESRLEGTWTKLRLRGRRSNYYGLGAQIKVVAGDKDGREVNRYYLMDNKTGFGSAPYLAHIGLADAVEIKRVEVTWPGDLAPRLYKAELGALQVLDEGGGWTVGGTEVANKG